MAKLGWAAAGVGAFFAATLVGRSRANRRTATAASDGPDTADASRARASRNAEDRQRAGTSDDILGISHGGGRDQYGGSFGGGQSGGGAYANPHSHTEPGQGGNSYGGRRGSGSTTGGQSGQGYYGGGQLGDRNYGDHSHSAASTMGGPEHGQASYRMHASQRGEKVDDALSTSLEGSGFDEHRGFGADHQGQRAQGREHEGPHGESGPEAGRDASTRK